jgi:hypothetical protein
MPSATKLIFLRSVESYPAAGIFSGGSMEADFVSREHASGPILIASDGSMTA